MLLKFNFRKCKVRIDLKDHAGVVIREDVCHLERGHTGMHQGKILTWFNAADIISRVEAEGRSF